MPKSRIRIAILECDTPLPGTKARSGGYGGVFTALLQSAISASSLTEDDLKLSIYDVVTKQAYPGLDSIDAILISGSKYNSFDNDPWILKLIGFVKECFQKKVRVIGVCFGHQIVGRALGAKVGRSDDGWEIAVTAVDLTKRGQEIFGRPTLAIHQMHRDKVYTFPDGVEELAYTTKCANQAMYVKGKLITVQGHPEFTEEIVREIVEARHTQRVFDDEVYQDALDRVGKYQDGVHVAQAFLRFVMED